MPYKKWFIFAGIVLLLLVGGLGIRRLVAKPTTPTPTYTVAQGTLVANVEFTGHLEAKDSAKLGFESTGVARQVNVDVGDVVTAGQKLAVLDPATGELEVAKAVADRSSATATAQTALNAAQSTAQQTITTNQKTVARAQQAVRNAKTNWDESKVIVQKTVAGGSASDSAIETLQASVISNETLYKSAQVALTEAQATADKANAAAQAAVTQAQTALANTLQTSATQPGLSSLEALEQMARVRLSKTTLTAPFNGVITDKKIASGELAVAGTPLLTIETTDDVQITADVAETDVTQLQIGQPADITFDAYPADQKWSASITKIAPTAIVLSGVPTYHVTLELTTADQRLKPGLTANIQVHTQHKDNVLLIPRRAVISDQGHTYVQLHLSNGSFERREVTTGLTDSEGQIEVVSGLQVGDVIELRPVSPT